jgi:hypothetical protein
MTGRQTPYGVVRYEADGREIGVLTCYSREQFERAKDYSVNLMRLKPWLSVRSEVVAKAMAAGVAQ